MRIISKILKIVIFSISVSCLLFFTLSLFMIPVVKPDFFNTHGYDDDDDYDYEFYEDFD